MNIKNRFVLPAIILFSSLIIGAYLGICFTMQKLGSYYYGKGNLETAKVFYGYAKTLLFFSNVPETRIKKIEYELEAKSTSNATNEDIKDTEVSQEKLSVARNPHNEKSPRDQNTGTKEKELQSTETQGETNSELNVENSIFPTEPIRDSKHPIIIKVSDSKGNYTTGSTGNGIPFFVTWPDPRPKILNNETITIKVEASDPNKKDLKYKFMDNSNKILKDWSSSNTLSWEVDKDQGGSPFIVPMIKNDDDVLRYGDTDDSTVLYYELK